MLLSTDIKMYWMIVPLVALIILIIAFLIIKKHQKVDYDTSLNRIKSFNRKLKKYAKGRDFLFLNDVFLPYEGHGGVRIDNVLIGNKYIYVITNRNWEGSLKGYEYDTKWLLAKKNNTYYVDNPINSNRYKVGALLEFLKEEDDQSVVNVVVLKDNLKFEKLITKPLETIAFFNEFCHIIDRYERNCPLNDIEVSEQERIANELYTTSKKFSKLYKGR